jgi:hypothetical protein
MVVIAIELRVAVSAPGESETLYRKLRGNLRRLSSVRDFNELLAGQNVDHVFALAEAQQAEVGLPIKGRKVTETFMRTRNTVERKTHSKPTQDPKVGTPPSRQSHCLSGLLAATRRGEITREQAHEIASRWRKESEGSSTRKQSQ